MKTVIYKALGTLYTTPENNFNINYQNANKVQTWRGFSSPEQIIEACNNWYGSTPDEFIIDASCK